VRNINGGRYFLSIENIFNDLSCPTKMQCEGCMREETVNGSRQDVRKIKNANLKKVENFYN